MENLARREGRTVFICTHNLDEADRLCDRVAVFKSHLRVVDTPAQLRKQLYGRQVVVHLAEDAGAFASRVVDAPGVSTSEVVGNKLLITLDEPERDNPEIVRRLVMAGAQIQFVGEIRHSLEDVYLQLLDED